ncbi:anti-anti-sigma factor [Streptomyces sp. KhCrAH-43]|uniref:STAS domain-containing protein n=1 Tax=unclassified Streptomyces TaxID=2593676 RepID=UPI00037B4A61|nr:MULTISPECIES: STAS domain-containing protein [unclassified Streptomyces]MYS39498.1 STAS domain-containing protein [Streptomyces sp. SID4920]MYX69813.1 STAS domain-containing protein [Streptomyces sp. SID8373]RAJ59752.1 anti-anti-sigma factor [Streptomyces sp. KhCrAH-43]
MTSHPDHLHLTTTDFRDSVLVEIHGDLDYAGADRLVAEVASRLSEGTAPSELRLRCAHLGAVDSMGISALLMIRRLTTAAGVRLHLDDRPDKLERLLDLTGIRDHLTGPSGEGAANRSATKDKAVSSGPIAPDTHT